MCNTSETFVDENGDGYSDYKLTKEFRNGKLVEEKKQIFEEDLEKDCKLRPWERNNRRMTSLASGMLAI